MQDSKSNQPLAGFKHALVLQENGERGADPEMVFAGELGVEIRHDLVERARFGIENREEALGFLDSEHGYEGGEGTREGNKESSFISSTPSGDL